MYNKFDEVNIMTELKSIVSGNLRRLCKEKGLTQVKLSELTGIPKATLGHYFTGENLVTLESLIIICDVINCSSDEILGRFNEEAYVSEILKDEELKNIVLFLKDNPNIKDIVSKICK